MAHLGHSRLRTIVATVLFLLASAAAFSNPLNPPQQQQQSVNLPQLSGLVDDCCCSVSDTQHVNDNYIARALDVLVKRKFFRFFKVNLDKDCPFWAVEKTCGTNGGCDICHCNADEIPVSWRQTASDAVTRGGVEHWKDDDGDMWLPPEEGSTSYVDLTKNGEKNTGYVGPQATRVWAAIYQENCFPANTTCYEERVFFRLLSGFQSSITAHIFNNFYACGHPARGNPLPPTASIHVACRQPDGTWKPNVPVYVKALGSFPDRIKNLYFSYLFLLRAVNKAAPVLAEFDYMTGNQEENTRTRAAVLQLLSLRNKTECSEAFEGFNERSMFVTPGQEKLRDTMREKFRNVSAILDCIACESCRMQAKLKVTGISVALRVLLTDKSDVRLERNDIIALVNTLQQCNNVTDLQFSQAIRICNRLSAMARGQDDPGLLTFEIENDAAPASVKAEGVSSEQSVNSQEQNKRPAPPASANTRQPVATARLGDLFEWLKQNSIYVVSAVLVSSLGAVLLLASPAAPSLPSADALYLKTFETHKGCMKLSNGVLYRQLKAGAGKRPGTNSSCVCVCKGTLVDGTVFFNGSARSADGAGCTLVPRSLVQGLGAALLSMQEGAHWDVVVPPQLAYQGSKHACDNGVTIPPWSVLKFDIELVQVNNNA